MPYKTGTGMTKYSNWNSYSSSTFDVNTGYALANTDFRTHTIFTHGYWGYFFEPIQDTEYEVVSLFNYTSEVNMASYISTMYPGNGTGEYDTGKTEIKDYTTNEVDLSMCLLFGIPALAFLLLAGFFMSAYYKAKKDKIECVSEILYTKTPETDKEPETI